VSAPFRRAAAFLAALALAGFCVAAAPRQWALVVRNFAFGSAHVSDPLPVARRAIYGPRFMRGIDAIKAVIPPDADYWLEEGLSGDSYWVRGALAPRRPHYLGSPPNLNRVAIEQILTAATAPFVVVGSQPDAPPALVDPRAHFRKQGSR